MIDRYAIATDSDSLNQWFNLNSENVLDSTFNAFPTKLLPVITNENPDGLSYFFWGQTPEWSNQKKLSQKFFNVPGDQVFSKASYKNSALKSRCIVPMTGFYLWRKVGKKTSVPYYYTPESKEVMAVAGIWEEYSDFDGNNYHIFNMITSTPGNESEIEMPHILDNTDQTIWLSPDSNQENLVKVIKENSNISLVSHTVSPLIAKTNIDNQTLITHQPPSDQHGNYTLFG